MKKALSLFLMIVLCLSLCSCEILDMLEMDAEEIEETPKVTTITTVPEAQTFSQWKDDVSEGIAMDLEYAFSEIGEKVDEIEKIEFVDEIVGPLFVAETTKFL